MVVKLVGCRLCFDGGEPLAVDERELSKHVESVHHILIKREGESNREARKRFLLENPGAWK